MTRRPCVPTFDSSRRLSLRRAGGSLCLPLLLCLSFLSSRSAAEEGVSAKAGLLDLRSWNFAERGSLPLGGEWDFVAGRLLGEAGFASASPVLRMVPDRWRGSAGGERGGRGAGSYRLRILLPPSAPPLALRYSTVSTAFELEVDGVLLASAGKPALDAHEARPRFLPGVVALPKGGEELDLVVRVSNHEYREGGLWRPFILGPAETLFRDKARADTLVYVLGAAILVMAANSILIFLFRRQEKAYLFFALFALTIFLRLWVTGEYLLSAALPGLPFDAVIRLEYLSVSLPIPLFAFFLKALFAEEGRGPLVAAVSAPFLLQAFLGLPFEPLPFLTRTVYAFYLAACAAGPLLFFGLLLPALRRRRVGARGILVGGILLAAAVVNDILYTSFGLPTGNLIGFGLLAFMLVQSGVLGLRFSAAFDRSEALQRELATLNGKLEEENRLYRRTQARLEETLAEKELLLREVHHRVKNSLQIVSSSLGLQSHRTRDPAVLEVYATARQRIRAISLVHEKLYGLRSAEFLDLGDYTRDLVEQLAGNFGDESRRVSLKVEAVSFLADVDDCVDFGLILTELVVNAVKHAGGADDEVGVTIVLGREGERLLLRLEDGGPGFPEGFDPATVKTLGFRIVSGLVRKHQGSLLVRPGPGGRIEIRLALADRGPGGGSGRPTEGARAEGDT